MCESNKSSSVVVPASQMVDLSDWMSELPPCLQKVPLNCLAIPGSHNSFTYDLVTASGLGLDAPDSVQTLVRFCGGFALDVVQRWSITQSMTVYDQLVAGVRYLDIRLASKPGKNDLYCVHGLYGDTVTVYLAQIVVFLDEHPKEVVLLDFNHFYEVTTEAHLNFTATLVEWFGPKMCPMTAGPSGTTLESMWSNGYQLVVFYDVCCHTSEKSKFWPGSAIPSPWPNVCAVDPLIRFLDDLYENRRLSSSFEVFQGVLTPDTSYILGHVTSSLKDTLAAETAPVMVKWLHGKHPGNDGINVCMIDFVEKYGFVRTVIELNACHCSYKHE